MSILDEPAFPVAPWRDYHESTAEDGSPYHEETDGSPGMSLRTYLAIHLCLPESGNKEIDAMIRRAQRQRLAGLVMSGDIAAETTGWPSPGPGWARELANALLAELEKP